MSKETSKKRTLALERGGLAWSITSFVESALLLVLGILAIAFSGNGESQKLIFLLIGIFLSLGGVLKILMNLFPLMGLSVGEAAAVTYSLAIMGAIELAAGITFISLYAASDTAIFGAMIQFVVQFLGILLIVAGGLFVLLAVIFLARKIYKAYLPILEIVAGLGFIALGIVILYFLRNNPGAFMQIVMIIAGVVLILGAIFLLIMTIQAMSAYNKKHKSGPVEAKVKVIDED